jgi:hypothetical protein
MKQTAVEFLVKEFSEILGKIKTEPMQDLLLVDAVNKAKEMEKQQIIDAGNNCALMQHIHEDRVNQMSIEELYIRAEEDNITFGEQYYNETFNKE